MVLAWVGLWVLAVPFVHVHPEVDHHHGEEGHTHGGLVHTIWSPDLECEFHHHGITDQHQGQNRDGAESDVENGHVLFHAGGHHDEFTLTMFSDASDRRLVPSPCAYSVAITHPDLSEPACESHFGKPVEEKLHLVLLPHDCSPRAPPFF